MHSVRPTRGGVTAGILTISTITSALLPLPPARAADGLIALQGHDLPSRTDEVGSASPQFRQVLDTLPRGPIEFNESQVKAFAELTSKEELSWFKKDENESGPAAAERLIVTLLSGSEKQAASLGPARAGTVIAEVSAIASLDERTIGICDYFLKHTRPEADLDQVILEYLGQAASRSLSSSTLLLQIAFYHLDDALAQQAAARLSSGHPVVAQWLLTERDGLTDIRAGRSLGSNGQIISYLTSLAADVKELKEKTIPALQALIAEQDQKIKDLEERNAELARAADEAARALEELQDEVAAAEALDNRLRREERPRLTKVAGWGAAMGRQTEDIIPIGARIVAISCRYDDHVNAIWLTYEKDGRRTDTPRRGGRGGSAQTVQLDDDEYIKFISHRGNNRFTSHLQVYTNRRNFTLGRARTEDMQRLDRGIAGRDLTRDERREVGCSLILVGFRVRADDEVRCVGAIYQIKRSEP